MRHFSSVKKWIFLVEGAKSHFKKEKEGSTYILLLDLWLLTKMPMLHF